MGIFRIAIGILMISAAIANAGGFEKNIMWSGKAAGTGGAVLSTVQGAEALFFNPARLSVGKNNQDISINISPTSSQYKGPIKLNGSSTPADLDGETSEQTVSPVFGLLYRYKLNEKLGLGVGYYVSGGTSVTYSNVPVGSVIEDEFKSSLTVTEFSFGGGYKLDDTWSIGAAWRFSQVAAEFATGGIAAGPTFAKFEYTGFTATNVNGLRFGVAYNPNDDWGLGLSYRTSVPIEAKGDGERSVRFTANGATAAATESDDTTVNTEFPQQISFGGHYTLSEAWILFSELWWTNYSKVDELAFESDTTNVERTVKLKWDDQINLRLAASYKGWGLPLNFGYIYTTPASNPDYALPTLSTPAVAHTLTLGSSGMVGEGMELSGALEYSTSSGEVSDPESSTTAEGTYSSSALALHLGLNIGF